MEIEVGASIDRTLKGVLERNGEMIVESLSKRYGFSKREAMEGLNLCSVKVEVERLSVKRSEKSKIPLPFCGEIQLENCCGIRLNHGLYTQCTNSNDNDMSNGERLCSTCYKQTEKNSNGEPTYGYISDRVEKGDAFRDPKGKVPVLYGNIMEKLNITRREAEKEAANQGITIPEEQFQVKKAQRGRPKKNVVSVDTSESEVSTAPGSEDEQKKPRGRPKKEKKVVTSVGEELIKNLVKEVETSAAINIETMNEGSSSTDEPPSPPTIISTPPPMLDENESSDDEELAVVEFKFKGQKYLKASNNTLYCPNTHDEVGVWNPKTKTIDDVADSDDD